MISNIIFHFAFGFMLVRMFSNLNRMETFGLSFFENRLTAATNKIVSTIFVPITLLPFDTFRFQSRLAFLYFQIYFKWWNYICLSHFIAGFKEISIPSETEVGKFCTLRNTTKELGLNLHF